MAVMLAEKAEKVIPAPHPEIYENGPHHGHRSNFVMMNAATQAETMTEPVSDPLHLRR